ncbi:MAG TPA: hypothetical protein VLC47_05975 [Burkholderiales bacterium]|nr:hypothetical protein [Burkholderiales bacterium]
MSVPGTLPKACAGDAAPAIGPLDMSRYRADRVRGWISRWRARSGKKGS